VLVVALVGCGGGGGDRVDGGNGGADAAAGIDAAAGAHGTARLLNGATPPTAALWSLPRPGAAAAGNWQLSPDQLRLTAQSLELLGESGPVTVTLADCQVTYDRSQPGLTQLGGCPFEVPPGTYSAARVIFAADYDLLIDDAVNGFYTDPGATTGLSPVAPISGAQFISVSAGASFGGTGVFDPAVVVNAGDQITLSVVVDALQSIIANVSGSGDLAFGADGNGNPGRPESVVAVGTPAAVAYYVNDLLGTPLSYLAGVAGQGIMAISVLYSNGTTPVFLDMHDNGQPTGCGPFDVLFYFSGAGHGYLGRDSGGVIGWAGTDDGFTGYTSVMRMTEAAGVGDPTVFECLETTTDPAPAGDSFASGAPDIPSPTLSLDMTLMAD